MGWISDNAALWAFLALPVVVLVGLPAAWQLMIDLRDGGRTTQQLHTTLRNTRGRVAAGTLRSPTMGTGAYLPLTVTGATTVTTPAIEALVRSIATGRSLVITAGAGAGKTRLLEELHGRTYATARSVADPLVELVDLSGYGSRPIVNRALLTWAIKEVAQRYGMSSRALGRLVSETKVVLAFDGLDELPVEQRREAAQQIARHPQL